MFPLIRPVAILFLLLLAGCRTDRTSGGFQKLFPMDGIPQGWRVSDWSDVSKPPQTPSPWRVELGILHGSDPRGTWLISESEYADFVLRFEWKLGERGNSGCGLRFPSKGDPAFDGLELQMVDNRYYPGSMTVHDHELTGSLYKAVPPAQQLYKPMDWNSYEVTCRGSKVKVVLNGVVIQDLDLELQTAPLKRHDETAALSLRERPRRGHIGFQELSRGGGHVMIRNAEIKELSTTH